jgi:hypothetical protein
MLALRLGLQTLRRFFLPGPMPELNVYVQVVDEAMHASQDSPVPRHFNCRDMSNGQLVQHRGMERCLLTFLARQISQAVRENWAVLKYDGILGGLLCFRFLAGSLHVKVVNMVKCT